MIHTHIYMCTYIYIYKTQQKMNLCYSCCPIWTALIPMDTQMGAYVHIFCCCCLLHIVESCIVFLSTLCRPNVRKYAPTDTWYGTLMMAINWRCHPILQPEKTEGNLIKFPKNAVNRISINVSLLAPTYNYQSWFHRITQGQFGFYQVRTCEK